MNQFLYKGFIALDEVANREDSKARANEKKKDDYLFKYVKQDEEEKEKRKADMGIIDYKVNMPKSLELSAVKWLNEPKFLKQYMTGFMNPTIGSENFEQKFLLEQPRLLWETEKLEDLGDLVLMFPNPDKEQVQNMNKFVENGLLLQDAKSYLADILDTGFNYMYKKKFTKAIMEAFENSFIELDVFEPLSTAEKKKLLKAALDFENALNSNKKKEEKKAQKAEALKKKNEESKGLAGVIEQQDAEKHKLQEKKDDADSSEVSESQQDDNAKFEKDEPVQEIKEENDAKNKEAEEAQRNTELLKMRRIWGGKYHLQPDPDDPKQKYYWPVNRNGGVNDVMTLFRKTILLALANQGFIIREFICNDGQNIAAVLTLPERNLKKVAKVLGFSKEVEFGVADLMSLEPIDSKDRPLRINAFLRDESLWSRTYEVGINPDDVAFRQNIRKTIIHLLDHDCNMKKIVRMCEGVWTESETDMADIYDPEVVDFSVWEAYRNYLVRLSFHIKEIKTLQLKISYILEKYYMGGKIGARGNQSSRRLDNVEVSRILNRLVVRAFNLSLTPANSNEHKLRTMWDSLGMDPLNYSYSFRSWHHKNRPNRRRFYEMLWADKYHYYPYDEASFKEAKMKIDEELKSGKNATKKIGDAEVEDAHVQVSHYLFSKVERIKFAEYVFNTTIDLKALEKFNAKMERIFKQGVGGLFDYIFQFKFLLDTDPTTLFPLHNMYELKDKSNHTIFKKLRETKEIYNRLISDRFQIIYQFEKKKKARKTSEERIKAIGGGKALAGIGNLASSRKATSKAESFRSRSSKSALRNKNVESNDPMDKIDEEEDDEEYENEEASVLKGVFGNDVDNSKMSQKHDPGSIEAFKAQLAVELNIIEKANIYQNAYLSAVMGHCQAMLPENQNNSQMQKNYFEKLHHSYKDFEEIDIAAYQNIADEYIIENDRLVDLMITCLNTNTPLREKLIKAFKKLTVFDLRSTSQKKLKYPLRKYFNITIYNNLEKYPESTVVDYFGEKIGLYFAFLNFYRDKVLMMSILGLIISVVMFIYLFLAVSGSSKAEKFTKFYQFMIGVFALFVVLWTKYFLLKWEGYEAQFAVKYGQTDISEKKTQRMNFQGIFKRSLVTDKINSFEESNDKRKRKLGVILTIFILCLIGTGVASFYLMQAKRHVVRNQGLFGSTFLPLCENCKIRCPAPGVNNCQECSLETCKLDLTNIRSYQIDGEGNPIKDAAGNILKYTNDQKFKDNSPINANALFFNFLEFLRIKLTNKLFFLMTLKLVTWLNLKYKEDHENHLIMLLSIFQLFNSSFTITIVAFQIVSSGAVKKLDDDGNEFYTSESKYCLNNDCSEELINFYLVYSVLHILWLLFVELVVNLIGIKILNCLKNYAAARYRDIANLVRKPNRKAKKKAMNEDEDYVDDGQPDDLPIDPEQQALKEERERGMDEGVAILGGKGGGIDLTKTLQTAVAEITKTSLEKQKKEVLDVVKKCYLKQDEIYQMPNKQIDKQVINLEGMKSTSEYDKEMTDYLALFETFSFTSLFGIILPFSFTVVWFIVIFETYLDKYSLFEERKRPSPQGTKSIGIWLVMLKTVASFSVISNCFYIAFILLAKRSQMIKFVVFVFMTVFLYVLMFTFDKAFSGLPETTITGMRRSSFIEQYLMRDQGFKRDKQGIKKIILDFYNSIFGNVDTRKRNNKVFEIAGDAKEEIAQKEKLQREMKKMKKMASKNYKEFTGESMEDKLKKEADDKASRSGLSMHDNSFMPNDHSHNISPKPEAAGISQNDISVNQRSENQDESGN